jgi:hypothetical protein
MIGKDHLSVFLPIDDNLRAKILATEDHPTIPNCVSLNSNPPSPFIKFNNAALHVVHR